MGRVGVAAQVANALSDVTKYRTSTPSGPAFSRATTRCRFEQSRCQRITVDRGHGRQWDPAPVLGCGASVDAWTRSTLGDHPASVVQARDASGSHRPQGPSPMSARVDDEVRGAWRRAACAGRREAAPSATLPAVK